MNIAFPVYFAVAYGMDLKSKNVPFELLIGIQVVSCAFLFDAFRRIIAVTRANQDLKINVIPMLIHATSYLLYLVALTYFWVSIYVEDPTIHSFLVS